MASDETYRKLRAANGKGALVPSVSFFPWGSRCWARTYIRKVCQGACPECMTHIRIPTQPYPDHDYPATPEWFTPAETGTPESSSSDATAFLANAAILPFELREGLLWRISEANFPRLCVPTNCVTDILNTAHGTSHHGQQRLRKALSHYCIPQVTKIVRDFVKTCPSCRTNNKPHHTRPEVATTPIPGPGP